MSVLGILFDDNKIYDFDKKEILKARNIWTWNKDVNNSKPPQKKPKKTPKPKLKTKSNKMRKKIFNKDDDNDKSEFSHDNHNPIKPYIYHVSNDYDDESY